MSERDERLAAIRARAERLEDLVPTRERMWHCEYCEDIPFLLDELEAMRTLAGELVAALRGFELLEQAITRKSGIKTNAAAIALAAAEKAGIK